MNHQLDDPMLLIYQYYPAGETAKPRRRRKKKEGGERSSNSSGVVKKRKLSEEQVNLLERSFVDEQKLETERKDKLASELCLDPQQVAVWFQNRRARWKNKKLEEEYSNLKAQDHTAIVDKCRLETEVLKMKEQLCEAEKEIQRLLLERNCVGLTSSMEQPHFLMDNVLFVADDYYITLWDN